MPNSLFPNRQGFTFIEVLVAILIFTMAVLAAVNVVNGSVQATRDSKEISIATWLLQSKMTELETRLEIEGVDKACDKKKEGKFEAPNTAYTFLTSCEEISINLSETASKLAGDEDESKSSEDDDRKRDQENMITKMILQSASAYFTKSIREIHVEVSWLQGKNKRQVSANTHFVRYDLPVDLPGMGGATGSGTTGTPGTNPSGGTMPNPTTGLPSGGGMGVPGG